MSSRILHRLAIALALTPVLWLGSCLERVDDYLVVEPDASATGPVQWDLLGSFGGPAEIAVDNPDPWEVRFQPGTFKQIAGICATGSEVWVCDLGLSRIQVFDFAGNYLRSYGAGMPLDGTLVSDREAFAEEDTGERRKAPHWEDEFGQRWVGRERDYFKVADVVVESDGYWVADQTQTSARNKPRRDTAVYFIPFDAAQPLRACPIDTFVWPAYLAAGSGMLAVAEPLGNFLYLVQPGEGRQWPGKAITDSTNFSKVMQLEITYPTHPNYVEIKARSTYADVKPGKFNGLGGIALAFDKLVACDTGNRRIQIFDARRQDMTHFGALLRVIPAWRKQGGMRFESPQDIDITSQGQVFVLDAVRHEVAVLSPNFARLGAFGRDELIAPLALDLSDDGRHCFVTDLRTNQVLHYAARN